MIHIHGVSETPGYDQIQMEIQIDGVDEELMKPGHTHSFTPHAVATRMAIYDLDTPEEAVAALLREAAVHFGVVKPERASSNDRNQKLLHQWGGLHSEIADPTFHGRAKKELKEVLKKYADIIEEHRETSMKDLRYAAVRKHAQAHKDRKET